jgi:hypothetical protein
VSLTDYDFARGEGGDHGRPPTIVEKCIAAVDDRGVLLTWERARIHLLTFQGWNSKGSTASAEGRRGCKKYVENGMW